MIRLCRTVAFVATLLPGLATAEPGIGFVESPMTPTSNPVDSRFGSSIEASDGVALIGALGAERVHVFTRSGLTWTEDEVLTPDAPIADEGFGFSLAISGDTILVGAPFPSGAPRAENGSVYVFSRSGGGFAQIAQLTPPAGDMFLRFGYSVALDGEDVAFVGAPHAGAFAGRVYRFQRTGDSWSLAETLEPIPPPPAAEFGEALAIEDGTLLIGAPSYDDPGTMRVRAGAVYVFERARGWTQTQLIRPADIADEDEFGASLALRGDTALIGAPGVDGLTSFEDFAGAAYVFERTDIGFVEREKLTSGAPEQYAGVGWDVALGEDVAYLGAPGDFDTSGEPARLYPFARTSAGYVRGVPLVAESTARHEGFGQEIAIDGTALFVGEPFGDAAWVYEVSRTCTADADCTDGDPCTTDTCAAPACVYTDVPGCRPPDVDAGVPDAGTAVDAGALDAGAPDAGADASAEPDAGDGMPPDPGGGCHVAPGGSRGAALWLLLALAVVWRRGSARS